MADGTRKVAPCVVGFGLLGIVSLAIGAAARAADEGDPRKPAAIATRHVPVVPGDIFARLLRYQHIRSAGFAGWSPEGRGMLVRTRFGNSLQLHRVYEPGGRREQWTFFDEPVDGRFIPEAPNGELLVTMSRGGDENEQIYLLDRGDYRVELLTDGRSRNLLGPVRPDGSEMIVHSNARNGRDTDLYVADCRRPDTMRPLLKTDGQYWIAQDWSPDGRQLLVKRYVSINESYPALLDVGVGALQPLRLPSDAKAAVGALAYSADGRHVYLTTDARGEFLELARLDLASLEYTWLSEDIAWDVSGLEVDRRHGSVAFVVNEEGASGVYILENDKPRRLTLPLGVVGGLEFSPDGSQLGLTIARADAPADAYSVRLADGELIRWTHSETGGLDPAAFVAPELIRFQSFDGRSIPAFYYRPKNATPDRPAAVVIQIHGGPEGQYRPVFSDMVQLLLGELGVAVVCPNVRGSAGYGKTYLTLDNGPRREDSVRDIGGLLDWVAQRDELDADRVAVTGASYGGYMVLASLIHYGDRLRAGVDVVGIANFITFLERTSPYRQDLRRAEYGDERDPSMRSVFERINPSAHADKIRSALLVAHGRNDPRVPFFEAEQIAQRVEAAGQRVWTVFADNEGHGFAKKDNRDYLTAVEVLFLQRHLLGEKRP